MVRWYHLIMTAYGFWLPNDPRGSWSHFVGAWEFYKFGPATKTTQKRSLAHDPARRPTTARCQACPEVPASPVRRRPAPVHRRRLRPSPFSKEATTFTSAASPTTMHILLSAVMLVLSNGS